MLGGIADRVAHVAHTTLIHQVYNEFHFVHTFKVRYLWLITGLDQGLETCADQGCNATAQDSLFTKEISFGLFGNSCAQDACSCTADRTGIGQGHSMCIPCGILMNSP